MIGDKYKSLTVISLDEDKNNELKLQRKKGLRTNAPIYYICQCDCGNVISLPKQKIKSRKTYGCNECSHIDFNNYIGKKINNWTILDYEKKNKVPFFKCKCICGKIALVNAYNVLKNKSMDCGCGRKNKLHAQRKDLVGLKFGKLTVIKKIKINKHGKCVYQCKCDCGNYTEVWSNSLTSNHTTSCGCSNSKYGAIVSNIVKDLGYENKREYYINLKEHDCEINHMRFDVFVPSIRLAIEYDGEFHFKPIPFLDIDDSINQLKKTQKRDMIKNKYCYENDIYILRIPYTKKRDIEKIIIETINLITCND